MEFSVDVERALPVGLPSTVLAEFLQGVWEVAPGAALRAGDGASRVRVSATVGLRWGSVEVDLLWASGMAEGGVSWWELGREVGGMLVRVAA